MRRPEIYFGEETHEYAIVRTGVREFDYPSGDANVYTSYAGDGGIRLDATWKKLLFAWRFGTLKFLLSDAVDADSRLLYVRRIQDRVRAEPDQFCRALGDAIDVHRNQAARGSRDSRRRNRRLHIDIVHVKQPRGLNRPARNRRRRHVRAVVARPQDDALG